MVDYILLFIDIPEFAGRTSSTVITLYGKFAPSGTRTKWSLLMAIKIVVEIVIKCLLARAKINQNKCEDRPVQLS